MQSIIPSNRRLKEEGVEHFIAHIKERLIELAKMKKEVAQRESDLKEQMNEIASLMFDMGLDELPISKDVKIVMVNRKPYNRILGLNDIKKKHPTFEKMFPELIVEVDGTQYIKLELIK